MTNQSRFAWQLLQRHFNQEDLTNLVSSRRRFASHLLPDLQSVTQQHLAPFTPLLVGVHQQHEFVAPKVSDLVIVDGNTAVALTPLQYQDLNVGDKEPYASLNNGLWLFNVENEPIIILLSQFFEQLNPVVQVEIAYLPSERAGAFARDFLSRIETAGKNSQYYRGKVISFEGEAGYSGMQGTMRVHDLAMVNREDVVLSEATMSRLDTHVFDFDQHREGLKRLGQSARKGIMLYGPPGTGKTHVIRYISANLHGRTTILVTAEQMKGISSYMALANTLQPSIVVMEDVDLIGRARENVHGSGAESLLNRLLNEMDGLALDTEILFILTTNRPEEIEEALASRPGRVDEAIEIPLPDDDCRGRLIGLYGRPLSFREGAVDKAVLLSDGGSAAYLKEMVRRLAQRALSRDGGNVVTAEDVTAVFDDPGILKSRIGRSIVGLREAPAQRGHVSKDNCSC